MLYNDGQLKIMVVGGPNTREDYHIENGEVRRVGSHIATGQSLTEDF